MKIKFYFALLALIPAKLMAQPVITNAENHTIGTSYLMYECDTTGITPGDPGANQHWLFDNLAFLDSTRTFIVSPSSTPQGSQFSTATYATADADGYSYFETSATEINTIGYVETSQGLNVEYTNPFLAMVRPLTYGLKKTDTFEETTTQQMLTGDGGGTVTIEADGYGMLHLPEEVFFDVLRVKMNFHQVDSFTVFTQTIKSTVDGEKYVWYDTAHAHPLLVIDKTTVTISNPPQAPQVVKTGYVMHIAPDRTTGIKNVKLNASNFKGAFENNTLHLNGKFATGSKYNVTILSLTGEKVASHSITGNGTHASFDVANNLPNGVYLIAVHEQNTQRIPEIIKVVKQ